MAKRPEALQPTHLNHPPSEAPGKDCCPPWASLHARDTPSLFPEPTDTFPGCPGGHEWAGAPRKQSSTCSWPQCDQSAKPPVGVGRFCRKWGRGDRGGSWADQGNGQRVLRRGMGSPVLCENQVSRPLGPPASLPMATCPINQRPLLSDSSLSLQGLGEGQAR